MSEPDSQNEHLDLETLRAARAGRLDDLRLQSVKRHLSTCEVCQTQFLSKHTQATLPTIDGKPSSDTHKTVAQQQRPAAPPINAQETLAEPSAIALTSSDIEPLPSFGDYELLSEVARGGMGVVYRARQRKLNRIVALKMILAGQFASSQDVKRFYSEAEAAAKLDHPGIVPIYEVGEFAGQHFFSMGFVDGQSLAAKVAKGPLPPREAAELMHSIAHAIAFAHSQGVIHRDLKPANVLLDKHGAPRITDFGLAKNLENESGLTQSGSVMGTPSYMPPEQASGNVADVGQLADVYSMGAMLYCLLTGRPPFQAATPVDTLMQVMTAEPVSPRRLNSQVPLDLATICLKCLEKSSSRRYSSASDFAAELQRYLQGESIQARPISMPAKAWRWCGRHPSAAALMFTVGCLLLTLLISVPYAYLREISLRETRAAESAARSALEQEQLARKHLAEMTGILRTSQAYNAWKEGQLKSAIDLLQATPIELRKWDWHYVDRLCHSKEVKLTSAGSERLWAAAVSSNRQQAVTCSASGEVAVWDVNRSQVVKRLVSNRNKCWSVAYCPTESQLVAAGCDRGIVEIWDTQTGELRFCLPAGDKTAQINALQFSGDGKLLVVGAGVWGRDATGNQNIKSSNRVTVWNWKEQTLSWEYNQHSTSIWGACIDPVGANVAFADFAGGVYVASLQQVNATPRLLYRHKKPSTAVLFINDNLVSAGEDGVIKIVNRRLGTVIRNLQKPGQVKSLTATADGKYLIAGGTDRCVTVWQLEDGLQIRNFRGHQGTIESVVSVDNAAVTSTGHDGRLALWDLSKEQTWTSSGSRHANWPWDMQAIRGTGDFISSARDGSLLIHDSETGISRSLPSLGVEILRIAVDKDSRLVAAACRDGAVVEVELASGKIARRIPAHSSAKAVAYNPQANILATSGTDGRLLLWADKLLHTHKGQCSAFDLEFSPDGRFLAAGCEGRIDIFELTRERRLVLVKTLPADDTIEEIAFNRQGTLLAAGGLGGHLSAWNTATWQPIHQQKLPVVVGAVAFSPDGSRLVHSEGEHVRVLDVGTFVPIMEFHPSEMFVAGLDFNQAGQLAVCQQTGVTLILDGSPRAANALPEKNASLSKASQPVVPLLPRKLLHDFAISKAFYLPDGRLVSTDLKGAAKIWKSGQTTPTHQASLPEGVRSCDYCQRDGKYEIWLGTVAGQLFVWQEPFDAKPRLIASPSAGKAINVIVHDPKGSRMLIGGVDGTIRIFKNHSETEVLSPRLSGTVLGIAVDEEGSQIAAVDTGTSVHLWDTATGQYRTIDDAHPKGADGILFRPNSKQLIVGGFDGNIRIWNLQSGALVEKMRSHQAPVISLIIHETKLISASHDLTVRIWSLDTHEEPIVLRGHSKYVRSVAVSPNRKELASASWDGSVQFWNIQDLGH
jgi:WD40 repeat protein/tRNA A-37 threonylcarbamoyl transferase component Bud32